MSTSKNAILAYQQKCYHEYAQYIGLPEPYTYPHGNPIRPLPLVQTAVGGLMIVGAYPSARFESRPSRIPPHRPRLVPVADNLQPNCFPVMLPAQQYLGVFPLFSYHILTLADVQRSGARGFWRESRQSELFYIRYSNRDRAPKNQFHWTLTRIFPLTQTVRQSNF